MSIVVATSVLAEGIDIPSCGLVLCSLEITTNCKGLRGFSGRSVDQHGVNGLYSHHGIVLGQMSPKPLHLGYDLFRQNHTS